jgi:hypothetical protein
MNILDIKNQVLAELPGNADNFVELHMLKAVQDMCRKTAAYTEIISIPTVIDQSDYTLASTITNTKSISFLGGTYNDKSLGLTDIGKLESCDPRWRIKKGTPVAFVYTAGGNTVKLYRIPQEIKTLTMEIVIMPTKVISALPEVIENDYVDAITNYVKWKVMGSDPINDVNRANLFKNAYLVDRDELKRDVLQNFTDEVLDDGGGWD